ncbi:hypothetical protein Ancab_004714 [Ancistrocladus abbreviatus]
MVGRFQQHNPGIFEGYPIRFKEVLVPPKVSSSPSVISLDSSNHPPVLRQIAGIVYNPAVPKLLQSVKNPIGKTAPDKVVGVARRFICLSDSVRGLPCPADRGIRGLLDDLPED